MKRCISLILAVLFLLGALVSCGQQGGPAGTTGTEPYSQPEYPDDEGRWDLDSYYRGFDDPEYEADTERFIALSAELHDFLQKYDTLPEKDGVEGIITYVNELYRLYYKIYGYSTVRYYADTGDSEALAQSTSFMQIYNEAVADLSAADRILGSIEDLDILCTQSKIISDHKFYITCDILSYSHILPDEIQSVVTEMQQNGGDAWSSYQQYIMSNATADYDGKSLALSEVRNLAYSSDPEVRKAAYEAELRAYSEIEYSAATALNNIKKQSLVVSRLEGYESPLEKSLNINSMKEETLNAIFESIEEYLPRLREYYKKKALLLGHENGLPWYDLYAPVGSSDRTFTAEESKAYLIEVFGTFSAEMSDMIEKAFEENWIDLYPRKGKTNGAFTMGPLTDGTSRILANFNGSFDSVDTLAHELGHTFHNKLVSGETPLNQNYPMPVAETASTFNEIYFYNYALDKTDSAEEKLGILDKDLTSKLQTVVDIYSRYLFETAVFENCEDFFLMPEDLNGIMLDCQKKAYGDGLDPEYLNSGMWICKMHYYYSSMDFYNFPYAFGALFSEGLYSLYKEQGDEFIAKYKEMLRLAGVHTAEESGEAMGVDLTDKAFWERSLESICGEIDEFSALVDEMLKK